MIHDSENVWVRLMWKRTSCWLEWNRKWEGCQTGLWWGAWHQRFQKNVYGEDEKVLLIVSIWAALESHFTVTCFSFYLVLYFLPQWHPLQSSRNKRALLKRRLFTLRIRPYLLGYWSHFTTTSGDFFLFWFSCSLYESFEWQKKVLGSHLPLGACLQDIKIVFKGVVPHNKMWIRQLPKTFIIHLHVYFNVTIRILQTLTL